mmetsp:Transcript_25725/g.58423  ORF Transcript_25725/g.58423 Transcript_25725/m.58423 type:complete len:120 (+) Transcript_25725:50-409(+)
MWWWLVSGGGAPVQGVGRKVATRKGCHCLNDSRRYSTPSKVYSTPSKVRGIGGHRRNGFFTFKFFEETVEKIFRKPDQGDQTVMKFRSERKKKNGYVHIITCSNEQRARHSCENAQSTA